MNIWVFIALVLAIGIVFLYLSGRLGTRAEIIGLNNPAPSVSQFNSSCIKVSFTTSAESGNVINPVQIMKGKEGTACNPWVLECYGYTLDQINSYNSGWVTGSYGGFCYNYTDYSSIQQSFFSDGNMIGVSLSNPPLPPLRIGYSACNANIVATGDLYLCNAAPQGQPPASNGSQNQSDNQTVPNQTIPTVPPGQVITPKRNLFEIIWDYIVSFFNRILGR